MIMASRRIPKNSRMPVPPVEQNPSDVKQQDDGDQAGAERDEEGDRFLATRYDHKSRLRHGRSFIGGECKRAGIEKSRAALAPLGFIGTVSAETRRLSLR